MMVAEESTAWPNVSRPTYIGGLGFGEKWMMGWMNDTLRYFQQDPFFRQYHHNEISFSLTYAFTENFMLPLSHDEVVHGKGALIERMPGDEWQRFANLRLLFGYMFTHPGTKLLFMGGEFGQTSEWKHEESLQWHLLDHTPHQGVQKLMKALNNLYTSEPALYEESFSALGFEWIDHSDNKNCVLAYIRKGKKANDFVIVVCNFTPQAIDGYRIGVPAKGSYKELLNSDAEEFYGSGFINGKPIKTNAIESHGHKQSILLNLPPLGVSILKKK
jgi:1,4-alpha-glucan branching enzyme